MNLSDLIIAMSIPSAVTGFCVWFVQRKIEKGRKELEDSVKAREENEVLMVQTIGAVITLAETTAEAVRSGNNNNIDAALEEVKRLKHKQDEFIEEQALRNLY